MLAGTLIGGLTGLFVMSYGVHPLEALLRNVRLGEDAGVSFYSIQLLLWHATVGAAALLAWWNPAPAWRLRVPAWGWATAFLLTEAVPLALHYARPHFSERDAARAIAEVSRTLEPQRRVMTGFLAHSLALESDIFPFYIRDDSVTGARMNLDGWERFRPTMAVTSMRGETVAESINGFKGTSNQVISMAGPQVGMEYWFSLTPKIGFQVNAQWFYSMMAVKLPNNGKNFKPTLSDQYGVMGSYKVNNKFTGLVGLTYKKDQAAYKDESTSGGKFQLGYSGCPV